MDLALDNLQWLMCQKKKPYPFMVSFLVTCKSMYAELIPKNS